jgi:protein TonB
LQCAALAAALVIPLLRIAPLPRVQLTKPPLRYVTLARVPAFVSAVRPTALTLSPVSAPLPRVFSLPNQNRAVTASPAIFSDGLPLAEGASMPGMAEVADWLTGSAAAPVVLPFNPPPVQIQTKAAPVEENRVYQVGGRVSAPVLRVAPQPPYPPLARAARIQGTVRLRGIIAQSGAVGELMLIDGHPLLVPAALAAVSHWQYAPALLNGQPVAVTVGIEVNFRLNQ